MSATVGTQTARSCPPSAVADQIVCWDEVQEGDLVVISDQFELAEKIETLPVRTGPGEFIRVTCRGHATDHRPFDPAAVRRYDTSEEQGR